MFAARLLVKAMLVTVISYFKVVVFNVPEHVAWILVPVELIF